MLRVLIYLLLVTGSMTLFNGCNCKDDSLVVGQDSSTVNIQEELVQGKVAVQQQEKPVVKAKEETAKPASKKRTDAPERFPHVIKKVVNSNTPDVQNCYRKVKRKNIDLKGNVKVLFVISPAGKVIGVKFAKSTWNDKKLGLDVERCVKGNVSTWIFAPIDASEGNVTASTSYTFE